MVRHERRTQTIHRVVYRELVGEIPEGFEIDHTCTEKLCANPRHLEAIAPAEHHRRTRERANERCRRREERRRIARLSDVCTSVYPESRATLSGALSGPDFPVAEIGHQMRLFAG
ncbi:HNH endonuclease signature motif containing protein [Rhodococcus sp. YH1]|uniref:HNH endonuclease signature motif containing protein n=1 Tax=Rhodococcus sp. YH1 TaxID=89066 RepID=UPI003FCF36D3